MNFNASRNVAGSGGPRKAKRVSDVSAVGAPAPAAGFSPVPPAGYGQPPPYSPAPGFGPPYREGIPIDSNIGYQPSPSGDFNLMGGFTPGIMSSPAHIGSMLQQPVVQDMALQYGGKLAEQGKAAVSRWLPVSQLRYYFAVDTRYVLKKLLLIVFPFTHQDWMVKYDQDIPVQPRYDLNAPDLYIPCMGYVTYVLLAGFMLGLQHRFSPEQIGMQASSALAYIIFEMLMYMVTLYVTNTSSNLKTLDLLAFSGYKYTTMISSLLAGLVLSGTGYYSLLLYTSLALSYFLVRTLRVQVLSGAVAEQQPYSYSYSGAGAAHAAGWAAAGGTKRRLYFLLFVAVMQPLLSWWLTYHLVPPATTAHVAPPAAL